MTWEQVSCYFIIFFGFTMLFFWDDYEVTLFYQGDDMHLVSMIISAKQTTQSTKCTVDWEHLLAGKGASVWEFPDLQQWGVDMRNDVRQSPPLSDSQAAGHLHQALNKVELLLLWVTDGQVPTVHVHLPCHLLRTAQFHLTHTHTHSPILLKIPMRF